MSVTQREIERPLGQGLATVSHTPRLTPSTIASGFAVLAILAASSAIALRDKPFRTPAPVVTTTPEVAAATGDLVPAKPTAAGADGGAKIIQLDPADRPASSGVVVIRDPSTIGQNLRVAHLPDPALIERTDSGPLPIRAADGRRPFDVYARPWSGARGARVAIVIGGFGISQTGTQNAIQRLPAEVTIAFSPQGNSIGRWMQAARQKGHEIVMQVPLEPFDYPNVDPGRNTLTVEATAEENLKNLRWALSRTTNYTGVMNFMGARFSADGAAMQPFLAELGKRGLLYLDDGSSARSAAPELALKNSVPFAAGDAVIDADRDRGAILKKLDEIERTARAKGFAIATGFAFETTIEAVTGWAAEAKKRGIEIVPISALASDPER
ncbi:divergent polysaccharide deacetylase family protein [Mesorhizobium sp. LHD-90]|uniref:divergent polysaccharide deacetylase family protein n=1 Tax=Mesorhizobium sp. LHD-90 TaxID=3071414 RepID=UPI0027E02F92|nr:divergent polysaccharide deacetylase family protein [Mesorhizobium sp. LHD-90]MDQ6432495.1 divergent polysaccharide deacetylase family protein [Mesorhizobium sp. LHD-90]